MTTLSLKKNSRQSVEVEQSGNERESVAELVRRRRVSY